MKKKNGCDKYLRGTGKTYWFLVALSLNHYCDQPMLLLVQQLTHIRNAFVFFILKIKICSVHIFLNYSYKLFKKQG